MSTVNGLREKGGIQKFRERTLVIFWQPAGHQSEW
jgi:hypothetical protein